MAAFRCASWPSACANHWARCTTARGRAYTIDLGGMKMRLVFEFGLEPFELSIVQNSGAIPRPAGVGVEILQVPPGTFGFVEAGALSNPWDVGTFKI